MPGRAQRWYSVESSISVRPHRTPPALESLAHFCRPGVSTWRRPTCPRGPSAPAPTTGRFSWRTWPARACPTLHEASIGSTSRRSSRPSLSAPHPCLPRPRHATGPFSNSLAGWTKSARSTGHSWAKTRPPKIPERPVPVLPEEDVRRLLADCSGKDFRDRRDLAIIRLVLDTGMRWKAWPASATAQAILRRPMWTSDCGWCGSPLTAKGRREMVLPIGPKAARDIDRYVRVPVGHPQAGRRVAVARREGAAHGERRLSDDQGPGGGGAGSPIR